MDEPSAARDVIAPFDARLNLGRRPRAVAGDPATTIHGATSWVTVERAPTIAPSPICTPGPTNTAAATQASASITIGAATKGSVGIR